MNKAHGQDMSTQVLKKNELMCADECGQTLHTCCREKNNPAGCRIRGILVCSTETEGLTNAGIAPGSCTQISGDEPRGQALHDGYASCSQGGESRACCFSFS